MVVLVIVYFQHTYLLPLFVGMTTWLKSLLKLLTPKFAVLFFKNSLFLKLKQFLIRSSTRFVVLSQKPWRHKMRSAKTTLSKMLLQVLQSYMVSPLWLRTGIALALLFATASSSYVLIALLIIPQPILEWVKRLLLATLNKAGITHLFTTVWRFLVPAGWQHRWFMHRKWTLGRHQVLTAMRLRETITTQQTIAPENRERKSQQ